MGACRRQLVGAACWVILVAGCGQPAADPVGPADPTTATQAPEVGAQPWLSADGDTLITCGDGPAFPAALVAAGGLEVSAEHAAEFRASLATMKDELGIDAPGPLQEADADEVRWALLWQESDAGTDRAGILIAEPGVGQLDLVTAEAATLEWQGEAWRASSWSGTCGARPALPTDLSWAQTALAEDPDATQAEDQTTQTTPTGSQLDLLVSEMQCTSARDPEPYLREPVTVETPQSVTIYWTTEAVTTTASCPANPWVARTVTLEAPLGDRALRDGSTYPPVPVRTVQEIESGPPR